jgi:23S rRNA (guanine745-N1)-methyltransferase
MSGAMLSVGAMSSTNAPGRRRPEILALACPVCARPLHDRGASASCELGHSFDFARSGYLNLTRSSPRSRSGDTAAMVRARAGLLRAGHFAPLAAAVAARAATPAEPPSLVVEVGSGTGYYLDAIASRPRGEAGSSVRALGIDLSKEAADHAARQFPDLAFVVADVQTAIPLLDGSVDVAVSVFAPRPAPELARVVRPEGKLVVAFAGQRHLQALRSRLGLMDVHADKLETLRERLGDWFEPESEELVEYGIELTRADAESAILMGPNARHDVNLEPLAERTADVVSVTVAEFRRTASAIRPLGA